MSKSYCFLVINPGSTSTKVALYQGTSMWDLSETTSKNLNHPELESEPSDQKIIRTRAVEEFIKESGNPEINGVAGRGGLTHPLEAGSYEINAALLDDLDSARYGNHASNLGAPLAKEIAQKLGVPSLIVDPVGVDQFEPLARYSGWPDLPRKSQLHALNMRSVAREAARDLGGNIEDFNFVIAHLGGGISIGPMKAGRIIDVNNAMDGGPFSPQRVGDLPTTGLIDLCYSGKFETAAALKAAVTRRGGLMAYLGTDDGRVIVDRINQGDEKALEVFHAMAYQISKEIGSMACVLKGKVDAILLTGGLPHPPLTQWISDYCQWIAPIKIYPGEMELLALARAMARHVIQHEPLLTYTKE